MKTIAFIVLLTPLWMFLSELRTVHTFLDWFRNREPGFMPPLEDSHDDRVRDALARSMMPVPGSQTEADEAAGRYDHVSYLLSAERWRVIYGSCAFVCHHCGEHDV